MIAALACAGEKSADSGLGDAPDYTRPGPHSVAVQRYAATTDHPPFLLWGPSSAPSAPHDLAALELEPDRAEQMNLWLADALADCPTQSLDGTVDGVIEGTDLPVVIISHCHACTASSLATIATHLATWGVVVAAVSHEGNTLYDDAAGIGAPLDTDTLALRVDQLDAWLANGPNHANASLHPTARVSVGHSFGAVTTGMVAQRPEALLGAVFLGAPAENPLLSGVSAEALSLPTAWVVLEEDNSIGALGNQLMIDNAQSVTGPTRVVRIPDAGHWSVSDIVGLDASTMAGCGEDTRQDGSGERFTYPDPQAMRMVTAGVVATAVLPWFEGRPDLELLTTLDGWNNIAVGLD